MVFYSGICFFRFSAVINLLLDWFSTTGFTIFYFPPSPEFCKKGRSQQSAIFEATIHRHPPNFAKEASHPQFCEGSISPPNFVNGSLSINADFSMFLLVMPENRPAILPSCNKIYKPHVFICAFFQLLTAPHSQLFRFTIFYLCKSVEMIDFFLVDTYKNRPLQLFICFTIKMREK